MNESRIIELEIKSAYQEELIESLNKIVAQQQQQISHLQESQRVLYKKMEALDGQLEQNSPVDEPPPHY